MAKPGLRILVGGAFARVPAQGGLVWMVMQYVLGLRQLGHEVVLVEPVTGDDLRPVESALPASDNAAYFESVARHFELQESATLLRVDGSETVGVSWEELRRFAERADLLIDLAGGLAGSDLLERIPVRLYLDLDPGFTQLWHAVENIDMGFAGHTHFATVALGFESGAHAVPTCGLDWIATPQPVVLSEWPVAERTERDALTTVANWRGYGSIRTNGVFYGQKAHSLREVIDLPRRTGGRFELALAIHADESADLAALEANGWTLLDPGDVAASPEDYRRFIQGSKAELGVAKSGYVAARCGWFSDRSVCYLASGRPVIAQETGFGEALPVGAGLFAFDTVEDVGAALEELQRDYEGQRRAARLIAEEYFASDRVLGRLLERLGVAA